MVSLIEVTLKSAQKRDHTRQLRKRHALSLHKESTTNKQGVSTTRGNRSKGTNKRGKRNSCSSVEASRLVFIKSLFPPKQLSRLLFIKSFSHPNQLLQQHVDDESQTRTARGSFLPTLSQRWVCPHFLPGNDQRKEVPAPVHEYLVSRRRCDGNPRPKWSRKIQFE